MARIVLQPLEWEVIDALFVQALAAHRAIQGDPSRPRAVMTEFVRLIEAEHNGWLGDKHRTGRHRRVGEPA